MLAAHKPKEVLDNWETEEEWPSIVTWVTVEVDNNKTKIYCKKCLQWWHLKGVTDADQALARWFAQGHVSLHRKGVFK